MINSFSHKVYCCSLVLLQTFQTMSSGSISIFYSFPAIFTCKGAQHPTSKEIIDKSILNATNTFSTETISPKMLQIIHDTVDHRIKTMILNQIQITFTTTNSYKILRAKNFQRKFNLE